MHEPYSQSELDSLDAHEREDMLADLGYFDDGNENTAPSQLLVWPMAFPAGARISE